MRLNALALGLTVILFTASPAGYAQAAAWAPKRAVELVVGVGPGGAADRTARTIQRIMQDRKIIQRPLTVMNRPGGGGAVGWTYIASHPGDGHFISVVTQQLLTNNISRRTKLSHNDLTPITLLFGEFHLFVVRADSSLTSPKVLLDRLRQDPGSVSFGIASAGGANHIAIGVLMKHIGVDVRKVKIVVFNSGAEPVTAMLGGHIDVALSNPASIEPTVKGGQARALAVAAPQRLGGVHATVPTWQESGVNAVYMAWRGIAAPPQLPPEQLRLWEQAFLALSQTDDWKSELKKFYWLDAYRDGAATKKFLDDEYVLLRTLLEDLGLI